MTHPKIDPEELARRSVEHYARLDASARIPNPAVDQYDAEWAEARRLAPRENETLRSNPKIQAAIHLALTSIDRDALPAIGPVPVIRLMPLIIEGSNEYTRNGTHPIIDRVPIRYCNACWTPTPSTVAFWFACGLNIVQIDTCGSCADHFVFDLGAKYQTASED
jgi:hypothetical protein